MNEAAPQEMMEEENPSLIFFGKQAPHRKVIQGSNTSRNHDKKFLAKLRQFIDGRHRSKASIFNSDIQNQPGEVQRQMMSALTQLNNKSSGVDLTTHVITPGKPNPASHILKHSV